MKFLCFPLLLITLAAAHASEIEISEGWPNVENISSENGKIRVHKEAWSGEEQLGGELPPMEGRLSKRAFRVPTGGQGRFEVQFYGDDSKTPQNLSDYNALQFYISTEEPVTLNVGTAAASTDGASEGVFPVAKVDVPPGDWREITVPFASFVEPTAARPIDWSQVVRVSVGVINKEGSGSSSYFKVADVRAVRE